MEGTGTLVTLAPAAIDLRRLDPEMAQLVRRVLLRGEVRPVEIGVLGPLVRAPQVGGDTLPIRPHPSAAAEQLPDGLREGRTLAWLAENERTFLFHIATNPWAMGRAASDKALATLAGLPLTAGEGATAAETGQWDACPDPTSRAPRSASAPSRKRWDPSRVMPAREARRRRRYVLALPATGEMVIGMEDNRKFSDWLFQRAGARWHRASRDYRLSEENLPLVARGLWEAGFVFDEAAMAFLDRAQEERKAVYEAALQFNSVWRGKDDAPHIVFAGLDGRTPRPHQRADIAFSLEAIASRGGAGLFLDMGLGKTFIGTAVYDVLRRQPRGVRLLVACPRSAFTSWRRELRTLLGARVFNARRSRGRGGRRHLLEYVSGGSRDDAPVGVILAGSAAARKAALGARPDVVIVSYDTARNSRDALMAWAAEGPLLVIADECHRMKDPSSQTAECMLSLASLPTVSDHGARLALSGTPISQGAHEFFSQAAFIDGGLAKSRFWRSMRLFCDRYFHIDRGKEGKWYRPQGFLSGERRAEFRSLFHVATVRRASKGTLDLPDLTDQILEVDLEHPLEQRLYELLLKIKRQEVEAMDPALVRRMDPSRLFLRMRQLVSHPLNLLASLQAARESAAAKGRRSEDLLALPEGIIAELENFSASGAVPSKITILMDLLEDLLADPAEKVIVCCDFDATERALGEALAEYRPILFRSELNDEERARAEQAFQTDPSRRVLIAKSSVISEGLTLTAARYMVLYDPACGFSTKTWEQVRKRIHRGGQTRPCVVYHLVATGTGDAYDLGRVIGKSREAGSLLGDATVALPPAIQGLLGRGGSGKEDLLQVLDALDGVAP